MYSKRSGLILGFHGCDIKVRDEIVSTQGKVLKASDNSYDWLGGGIYFWENNQKRALEFAKELKDNPPKRKNNLIKTPSVLGAVIDLGYCLDLLDSEYLKLLQESYRLLCDVNKKYNKVIPKNVKNQDGELLLRHLDCAVIETIHQFNRTQDKQKFDSVRGVFFEGKDLYPNAGFQEKNHIQIALRNPNCIKGYFVPRELDNTYSKLR